MNPKFFLLLLCSFVIYWRCAAIGPPTGGPKDTTPPELLVADPPSGTVRLMEQVVELQFSEYMEEKSFTDGIRIAPVLDGKAQIEFKGDRVFVFFPEGVKNEMTVVLTLGREIKDEHGVELAKPIQLAYSTGDEINNGIIKGKVFSNDPASVYLFYEDLSDSVLLSSPDYISEAEDDGSFEFNYLAEGAYKVLAIDRGASGARLDKTRMSYGIPFVDRIELDSLYSRVNMRMQMDTQPLRLLRFEWKDWNWGELFFNNELHENLTAKGLKVNDKDINWYLHPTDKTSIIVTIADTIKSEKCTINIDEITLEDKIIMDSYRLAVPVPTELDTNYVSINNLTQNLSITPDKTGPPLYMNFSRPLLFEQLNNFKMGLQVDDTVDIEFRKEIQMPMSFSIIPDAGWDEKRSYLLKIFKDQNKPGKHTLKDSITTIEIQTTKLQGYGSINGVFQRSMSANLIAEIISTENNKWNFKSVVNSEGYFEYIDIPDGLYTLLVYDDKDQNGSYTFGNAYPFHPSEWFYISPDTIEVRANWDIELQPILLEY